MPMIDVYAATGTFADKRALTKAMTAAMMRWEGVPPIALFKDNTAAFIHEMEPDALGNANADIAAAARKELAESRSFLG